MTDEEYRKKERERYYANRDKILARRKEAYYKNLAKFRARMKEYNSRPEVKEKLREYHHKYNKEYAQRPEAKERRRSQADARRREDPFIHRFWLSKAQAKRANREFTLTEVQARYFMSKPCIYCGKMDTVYDKPICGIDRLDNSKGYTLDNCVPCCEVCNKIKGSVTMEMAKVMVCLGGRDKQFERLYKQSKDISKIVDEYVRDVREVEAGNLIMR
jgi:hypothetical protein